MEIGGRFEVKTEASEVEAPPHPSHEILIDIINIQ